MTRKKKEPRRESQTTQVRRRNKRIADLYFHRGLRPIEIFDMLADEYPNASLRTVQMVVAELRSEAEPEKILALQRPAETDRYRRQMTKLLNHQWDVIESEEMVAKEIVTPKGDVVTVMAPRWEKDDKRAAMKDIRATIEKLGIVNGADVKGIAASGETEPEKEQAKADAPPPFQFVGSGAPFDDLVTMNLEKGKVN